MAQSTEDAMLEAIGLVKSDTAGAAQKPEPQPPRPKSIAELIYGHLVKETKK